jgi:transposase-like protein
MRKRDRGRNPLFAKRWFADQLIILLVRWYLRFRLSYRDLASIAAEMEISVAPSTILRWVIRYTDEFVSRWEPFELVVEPVVARKRDLHQGERRLGVPVPRRS